MGLRMGYGFAVTRKIGATEEIVQLVPVIAGGFALPKSQNPYQRPDDRYYRDYPGHRIAGSGEPESGEQYDPGNASADHGKIEIAVESEGPAGGIVRRIGVGEAQFVHGVHQD